MYVNVCGGVMREVTSCMSGEGGKDLGQMPGQAYQQADTPGY